MDQLLPAHYYHIYNHANGNENLFLENDNYRYFLQQYEKHIQPVADTLAYCLMPNHFHLLVKIRPFVTDLPGFENLEGLSNVEGLVTPAVVSKRFSNLFNSYTKAFNKKYDRMGSLFRKNFRRKQITSETQLVSTLIYIHVNPVHHGFTDQFTDWQWSSWHTLVDGTDSFLRRDEVLRLFGNVNEIAKRHILTEKEKLRRMALELE